MTLYRLAELLAGLAIPGGCDDCNACQTVTSHGRVILIEVHHDASCPWLMQHQARTSREPPRRL